MSKMSADNRRAPRYALRLSAELMLGGKVVTGTTRNLSMGGVCIELDQTVAEGAPLQLRLFLVEDDIESAEARGLELMGRVQWAAEADRGWAVGIQFQNLSGAQLNALVAALKTLESA
jgi:hypothetical protein